MVNVCILSGFSVALYRVAVVNKITDFLLFLGQLLIVALVVVGAFFYFTLEVTWVNAVLPVPAVNYYWVVIIVSKEQSKA